jgi:hypothetical protein
MYISDNYCRIRNFFFFFAVMLMTTTLLAQTIVKYTDDSQKIEEAADSEVSKVIKTHSLKSRRASAATSVS